MRSGNMIVHRLTQAEFNASLGTNVSSGFIEIVGNNGVPTGEIYMTGGVGQPAVRVNESLTLTRLAGSGGVSQFHVVYDVDGVTCLETDPTSYTQCQRILGLARIAAAAGHDVQIIDTGVLTYTHGLSSGPIYLFSGGALTQTPPVSGVFVRLGYVANATTIIVKIETPIRIL